MEEILTQLQTLQTKISNGTLSSDEMAQFVDNARNLYEKALILQYKAFEHQVYTNHSVDVHEEIIEEEKPEIPEITVAADPDIITGSVEETPNFDFSLFEDAEEETSNENTIERVEHVAISEIHEEREGIKEDKIVIEKVSLSTSSPENLKFLNKYGKTDPSLENQLSLSKLDSLIGSFGLNERLHFINDLFDGSSESFAEAIKVIDSQSNIEEALLKTSQYANQFNWEDDNETIEDCVLKIKRRYA